MPPTQCPQCGDRAAPGSDFCANGHYLGWDRTQTGLPPVAPAAGRAGPGPAGPGQHGPGHGQPGPGPGAGPAGLPPGWAPAGPPGAPGPNGGAYTPLPPQEPQAQRQAAREDIAVAAPPAGPSTTCQTCGLSNALDRTYCQRCGERLTGQPETQRHYLPPPPHQQHGPFPAKLVLTIVLALALIVAGVVFALSRNGDNKPAGAVNLPSTQPSVSTQPTTTQPTSTVADQSATNQSSAPAAQPVKVDRTTMTATASSTLAPNQQLGRSYKIENVLDSNLQTAWNSDGDKVGTGVGVVLTFHFAKPTHLIRLDFVNGYARNAELYKENGRVRGVQITTDSGTSNMELADRPIVQSLQHDFGTTSSVSITVNSVYLGSQFKDLALTEVGFVELK